MGKIIGILLIIVIFFALKQIMDGNKIQCVSLCVASIGLGVLIGAWAKGITDKDEKEVV